MEILRQIKDIHSVSEKEGRLLYKLAKRCSGIGVIVEVGSWKGYSTICLAKGSQDGKQVPVYAIDPHTGSDVHKGMYGAVNTYSDFINNITKAGVRDCVMPIVKTSEDAEKSWSGLDVELLWIDGDHKKADLDFSIWYPHLIKGGVIALHDTTTWDVPKRVAFEQIYKSDKFSNIGRVGSITFAMKSSSLSDDERRGNKIAFYERCVYQAVLPSYNQVKLLGAKVLGRA